MKTLTANLEETLDDWFDSHGLAMTRLRSQRKNCDDVRLDYAKGEFKPCYFDKEDDGNKLIKQYCAELALVDERFKDTTLIFDTDTTFRIL